MKQLIKCCGGGFVCLLWITMLVAQPKISRVEYYIDTDPGYGKGKFINITPDTNLSDITFNIDPSALSSGVHIVGIRAKDINDAWSHDNKLVFAKPYPEDKIATSRPDISHVEYYIDNDPGYGKGKSVSFTAGIKLSDVIINIDPSTLNSGIHFFSIRAKDTKGAWGHDNKLVFLKPFPKDTIISSRPDISRVEYYIDNDPGYGKAQQVSFTAGIKLSDVIININPATLTNGIHLFGIRARDTKGAWSHDNKLVFAKPYPEDTATISRPNISSIEYFIDNDPGYGKGKPVSFTAGIKLSDIIINIDPSTLNSGIHLFGIRAKDTKGAWSQDNKLAFAKPYPDDTATISRPDISSIEYYIDNDPGYGKAQQIGFAAGIKLSDVIVNINPATLTNGVHLFGIRAKDTKGAWCHDNKWLFAKPYPEDTATVSRPDISNVEYYIDIDPGYAKGTLVVFNSGSNLSDITLNIDPATLTSGVHLLGIRAKDTKGGWSHDNKWLFAKPYPEDTIAGITVKLSEVEYYFDNDPGYGKGVPVAIKDAIKLSNINLAVNISRLTAGDHRLFIRSRNASNAWSLDNVFDFNVTTAISTTSIVLNSVSRKTVCLPDTIKVGYEAKGTYNVGNIFKVQMSDASGSFAFPVVIGSRTDTGNSIITCAIPSGLAASSGYKLRVVSTDPTITGITSPALITVKTTHPVPVITPVGTVALCEGNRGLLAASGHFVEYLWNTGQTGKQIFVNKEGYYSVEVTDSGGCTGSSKADTVIILKKPENASDIRGADTVAAGQSRTYSVEAVAGLSYNWTVPSGAAITAGQGTSEIKVIWGSTAGYVTVFASNDCGASEAKQLLVTVNAGISQKALPYEADEEVKLYPNPASSIVTIVFTEKRARKYFIEVKDIAGKALLTKTGISLQGVNKVTLDVSKFANGMYIVNVIDGQSKTRSLKLNKQGL